MNSKLLKLINADSELQPDQSGSALRSRPGDSMGKWLSIKHYNEVTFNVRDVTLARTDVGIDFDSPDIHQIWEPRR